MCLKLWLHYQKNQSKIVTIEIYFAYANLRPLLFILGVSVSLWHVCLINIIDMKYDRVEWRPKRLNFNSTIWKNEWKKLHWFFHFVTQIKSNRISQTKASHKCWIKNDTRLNVKVNEMINCKNQRGSSSSDSSKNVVFLLAPWLWYSFLFVCLFFLVCPVDSSFHQFHATNSQYHTSQSEINICSTIQKLRCHEDTKIFSPEKKGKWRKRWIHRIRGRRKKQTNKQTHKYIAQTYYEATKRHV